MMRSERARNGIRGFGDVSLEEKRCALIVLSSSVNEEDMYGFTVRPQHLEKYLEHDRVYKEEEVHRSSRWARFLETHTSDGNANEGRKSASWWGSLRAVEQALQVGGACSWAEELKKLVWEGVPVSLRGELWQVFTGAKERWRDGYYQELLAGDVKGKWASQIEKDLPRTFPGHPVLAEDGLGSLRRMLTAYARHNPTVGYCQAMNFLAALLLLFMPEENAFWTLASIVDVYFEGYYTEKMTEVQVDQLVFTELVREQLPKLAKHLETVDVEISWISGAWFLSIFVNVLPWECVLRVWDVLLYDGNRSMLFRTALALLEMHAAPLLQLHDNGDVLSMLQSMGETTFDSSQLVFSACLGFQEIDEGRLERLRTRHRPAVIAEMHKRSLDLLQRRTTNGSAGVIISQDEERSILELQSSDVEPHLNGLKGLTVGERGTLEYQLSLPKLFSCEADEFLDTQRSDLQEEVSRLRKELDQALRAQEEAECRAEGLKHAVTEMDQSRHSPVEMERLKAQVGHLKQALADKREQEAATVEVLVRLEQENRKADDARRRAIEEAEENRQISAKALRRAAADLEVMKQRAQEAELKLEAMEKRTVMAESMLQAVEQQAADELRAMEKRALKAESMLQATLDFHSGSGPQIKRELSVDR